MGEFLFSTEQLLPKVSYTEAGWGFVENKLWRGGTRKDSSPAVM